MVVSGLEVGNEGTGESSGIPGVWLRPPRGWRHPAGQPSRSCGVDEPHCDFRGAPGSPQTARQDQENMKWILQTVLLAK